jgi:hypothetical protein
VQLFWLDTIPFVIVLTVLTIVHICRHKHGGMIAAWILLVICFPVIGSLVYWVMRKPTVVDVEQAYRAEADVRSRNQHLPTDPSGF